MKPINIYELTRITNDISLQKLERQMSKRSSYLKIKDWEINSLRLFIQKLLINLPEASSYKFYYSFLLPKLGKEFDLLRISEDSVINIELKSAKVPDEVVKKQLLQNKYYLSMLGKTIYSYTYISDDDRLVRLSNTDKIVDSDWKSIQDNLRNQTKIYSDDIESLFKEDKYIISPLSDPDRFLRRDYFLTSQQKDIEKRIINKIQEEPSAVQAIAGMPGTGKTLLLYDIAMKLSEKEKVCIIHFGKPTNELSRLNDLLKRIDFIGFSANMDSTDCEYNISSILKDYSAILVDEGHRINKRILNEICIYAKDYSKPIVFSYVLEDIISSTQMDELGGKLIDRITGIVRYQLTNRIRVNNEISTFVKCIIQPMKYNQRDYFPSVNIAYSNDLNEAAIIIKNYISQGFSYIYDNSIDKGLHASELYLFHDNLIEVSLAVSKEYDKVIMLIDETFFYNDRGILNARDDCVRSLFHGLSRAKGEIALVVVNNKLVFNRILSSIQK